MDVSKVSTCTSDETNCYWVTQSASINKHLFPWDSLTWKIQLK